MGKILWTDTETTGLDSKKNSAIEIAAIVEIDEEVKDQFSIQIKPLENKEISDRALEINGRTREEIAEFTPVDLAILSFKKRLEKHVNKFDSSDKFIVAGYNIGFDINFIRALFHDVGDKYYGSYFFNCPLDVYSDVAKLVSKTDLRLPNYKLSTVCNHIGIEIDAHDPVSDITATRELYYRLQTMTPKYVRRKNPVTAQ